MDSLPQSRVANSQPAGIGRLVSLGARCAWNNLGRNIVFADASLRPLAIFGDTVFPEDDEASQFDLDIHAIVGQADTGKVAVVNHLGSVSIFDPPRSIRPGLGLGPHLDAERRLDFVDDVERVVGLGDRLVTSRPRGRRLGGVLVTEPIAPARRCLDSSTAQESFGFVTALAAQSTPDGTGWVALGGEGRVRLVEADGGRLGASRWETAVDFACAALVASGSSLWAAGSALGGSGVDDYDWEQLGEGVSPRSTSPVVLSCHPPVSATTWPGEAAAMRWSWRTVCPAAWAATASSMPSCPVRRPPPGSPTGLPRSRSASPTRQWWAANSSSASIVAATGSTRCHCAPSANSSAVFRPIELEALVGYETASALGQVVQQRGDRLFESIELAPQSGQAFAVERGIG